jgi:hypothetical protein
VEVSVEEPFETADEDTKTEIVDTQVHTDARAQCVCVCVCVLLLTHLYSLTTHYPLPHTTHITQNDTSTQDDTSGAVVSVKKKKDKTELRVANTRLEMDLEKLKDELRTTKSQVCSE